MSKTLEKLQARKADVSKAMRELSDAAADRVFTEEESGKFASLKAEVAGLDARIATEKELVEAERAAIASRGGANAGTVATVAQLGPETGASKPNIVGGEGSDKFRTFGEYLRAVHAFEHKAVDGRLQKYGVPTGLNTVTPSEGGFLVPPEYGTIIIKQAYEQGAILARVNKLPLSTSDAMNIPYVNETSRANGSRAGGVRGYWRGQGDSVTGTKPAFGEMELKLKNAMCIGYVTDEMLKDYAFTGALLTKLFADELTFIVEDAVFEGTGAGQPQGITVADCKVQVAKESGQASRTICGDNIIKMLSRFPVRSRRSPGAAWLYNQDCEPQLWKLSARTTATEGASSTSETMPMLVPAGQGFNRTEFPLLMGIPLVPVEYCETLGTAGDLVLVDLAEYMLVEKEGVEVATSMHVKFAEAEQAFRLTYRVDGKMTWKSAITPFKGSTTISPVITLATRA